MKKSFKLTSLLLLFLFVFGCSAQKETVKENTNLFFKPDTVESKKFDTGKMWTFEDAPVDYFKEKYGFKPSESWLNDVRMSALKFANWCSASFVSEDGLVMTNHHCIEMISEKIQKEGEDIKENGFYASSLEEERKVPGLFVDQLVFIEDVTDEVITAMSMGKTDQEKIEMKRNKINELTEGYSEELGLKCKITELYNGGKYSLYGYRRYTDVRAVFFAEFDIGLYGGDPDNFTYPRYNSDFAFVRVYGDNGNPLKTDHYFKYSDGGAEFGEPIFVVGNPGSTQRLKTVAQLEYMRDFTYLNRSILLNETQKLLEELMEEIPEKAAQYKSTTFFVANSAKVFRNVLKGLRDPYLLARKKDFEEKFKYAVMKDPELKAKFGHIWKGIENTRNELRKTAGFRSAFALNPMLSSKYLLRAQSIVSLAKKLDDGNQDLPDEIKSEIKSLFEKEFVKLEEDKKLELQAKIIALNLGKDHPVYKKLFWDLEGPEAVDYALENAKIKSAEDLMEYAKKGKSAILESGDPFIEYIKMTQDKLNQYNAEIEEIMETEEVLEDELGQALFAVYGTTIPPDATFTLRISDGLMKGYNYNGTEAPAFTTFYGLYDRYYSHNKKDPWDLPESWKNVERDFDLSKPYNFVSTCDITGGSSGSPVINKDKEIVGLAFDGNIESIPGDFIFTTERNRMVSVASEGILEILKSVYEADRLYKELKAGRIK